MPDNNAPIVRRRRTRKHIFDLLVTDRDDIRCHIAYTLYKIEKESWIKNFKAKNHREPTEDERNRYKEDCCIPERIEAYKESAFGISKKFSEEIVKEAEGKMELSCAEKHEKEKAQLIEKHEKEKARLTDNLIALVEKHDKDVHNTLRKLRPGCWGNGARFLFGIFESILGTMLITFLAWWLIFVYNKTKIEDMWERLLGEKQSTQQQTTPPKHQFPPDTLCTAPKE